MILALLSLATALSSPPGAVWTDLTDEVLVRADAPDLPGTGPTHILVGEDGAVRVFAAVEGEILRLDGEGRVGERWRAPAPPVKTPSSLRATKTGRHTGLVERSDGRPGRWSLTTRAELGALHVLGEDRAGRLHVVVEELLSRSPVRVRRFWQSFGPEGATLQRVSLPPPPPLRVDQEWALSPEGALYLLQVAPERVQILRWGQP